MGNYVASETKIICVTGQIKIPDLSLILRKGDIECIPTRRADLSTDLEEAHRLGAVKLEIVQRHRGMTTPKKREPPWLSRPKILYKKIEPEEPEKRIEPETPIKNSIGLDKFTSAVREIVSQEITAQLKKELDSLKEELVEEFEAIISSSLTVMTDQILRNISQQTVVAVATQPQISDLDYVDDAPNPFIPTIRDAEGEVSIDAEENVSSGVDSATEALRALKQTKNREKRGDHGRKI